MPLGKPLGDFEYSETGDSITITWYSGKGRRVVIPDFIDGKPVTTIGERAFAGASESLTTVVLPSTLTTIKQEAFANCIGLSGTLIIPHSVRSIEDLAFANANGPSRTVFEGDAPQLGEWALPNTGITYNNGSEGFTTPEWNGYPCFPRDKVSGDFEYSEAEDSITITWYSGEDGRVVIPGFFDGKPVTTIGERAFAGSFESPSIVVLPPTLTTIKQKAFANCTGLSGT
ncbi:MAG TPA: leucine-rich repeat domain-containing protein, partial [Opitutales bacterium]|nr:leucine-rich repeat domain-containing protein [Opitutales bacterium]